MNKNYFLKKCLHTSLIAFLFIFSLSTNIFVFSQDMVPMISEKEYKSLSMDERKEYEQRLKAQVEQMNPAEQEAYMQEVVQNMFESLTPEQQQEVLAEAERIERMDETEQKEYFKKVEKDLEAAFGKPKEKPVEIPSEPKTVEEKPADEEKKQEIKVKVAEKEKAIKDAINLINEITESIDSLLVKLEAKEDFLFKLSKWGKKKKIKSWNDDFKWKELKLKIDIFRTQLNKLKDRDSKSKKYKYLLDLLENENLYNRLFNLSVDLADYEPSVRVAINKPLTKKVIKKSHKSIRSLINVFVALLFEDKNETETIDVSLNKLFEKFDPKAKKIKEEEQKIAEKALAESKKKPASSRLKVVGRADKSSGYEYGSNDYAEPYGEYDQYGDDYYQPEWDKGYDRNDQRMPKDYETKKPSPEKTPKAEEVSEDDEKYKKDRRMKKLNQSFDDALESISDLLDDYPKINDLYSHLQANIFDKKVAKTVKSIKGLTERATGKLESMQKRMLELSKTSQKAYKKDIKALSNEYKNRFEKLSENFNKKLDQPTINGLSEKMKWVYFKIEPTRPMLPAIQSVRDEFDDPVEVEEFKESIDKLLTEMKKTIKK